MKLEPKRILWPTDLSDLSIRGGRVAAGLCDTFGAELHVLHVVTPPLSPDVSVIVPAEVPVAFSEPEMLEASQTALERIISTHLSDCPRVVREVLFGNPWPTICKYAEEHDIDLIVTTTHGRTGVAHALIGSTAERIVQHAPCAVLTIRQDAKDLVKND